MMKKYLLGLSALTIGSVLMACGNGETSEDSNGETTDVGSEEVVELNFWSGIPAENGPQEAVDEWNENNPNIQVTYTRYVNDDSGNLSVNTALQTEEDIDILMSHSANDYYQRVESDFLMDMTDTVNPEFIDENLGAGAYKWEVDGEFYAYPTNTNAIFIMMNEDLLESKGAELPESLTWTELKDLAVELQDDSLEYAFALDAGNMHGIIQNAVIDEGFAKEDGTSNLDHENVREGLEILYTMMHEDGTMPILSEQVATNMAPEQMFLDGEIGMYQAGAWRLRLSNDLEEYPRDFSIGFIPYPNFEGQSTPAHHVEDAMSIVSYSEYQDEAMEFIDWYATEGMLALAPGGRVPAHKDAPQAEAREQIISGAEDTYNVDSLNATYEFEKTAMMPELPYQVLDNVNAELESYFLGNQDLDTTITNMTEFHNSYLER